MFGFFKNKNKDKVTNKDKTTDSDKEKKKEKCHKDDKEVKVTVRKAKEDKTAKSLFRKSKSLERAKEGSDDARKSQSRDSQGSEDWSDHDQVLRPDCYAKETEIAATSSGPIFNNSRTSEETPSNPSSDCLKDSASGVTPHCKAPDSPVPSDMKDRITSSPEDKVHTSINFVKSKPEVQSARSSNDLLYNCDGGDVSPYGTTQFFASKRMSSDQEIPSTLKMKPPLNPRMVPPRGPLATSTTTTTSTTTATTTAPFQASSKETNGENVNGRLTPSPGLVTPPASPGLYNNTTSIHQTAITSYSRPTSPDGRTSMLSTPSSSTSSLSSLTSRPISPSGRRTPPGPRMGTGGRVASSPTAGRKALRTNIKTNPSTTPRRAGSHSPVNSPLSLGTTNTCYDNESFKTPPSSPLPLRHMLSEQSLPHPSSAANISAKTTADVCSKLISLSPQVNDIGTEPSAKLLLPKASLSSATGKNGMGSSSPVSPRQSSSVEVKPDVSAQRSVSPTVGKARHSISSMHSLESIPEHDSDGQSPVALEKDNDGIDKACHKSLISTPTCPKENQNANVMVLRSTRHSAPEVKSERQYNHSMTHKRSSSLTPVSEERKINVSVSVSDTKRNLHHGTKAESIFTKAGITPPEISTSKKHMSEKRRVVTNKKDIGSHAEATNLFEVDAAKNEEVSLTSSLPSKESMEGEAATCSELSGKSFKVIATGMLHENSGNDTYEDNPAKLSEDRKHSTEIDSKETEEATHVVLQIPLRRASSVNTERKEKRASVEILSREAGGSKQREKEHRKTRPRSVSASRELRRERTFERQSRRAPSEGSDDRNEDPAYQKGEGQTGEIAQSRSFSSRRSKSFSADQNLAKTSLVINDNESYDGGDEEVIIPWRKGGRGSSQGSSKDGVGKEVVVVSNEAANMIKDLGELNDTSKDRSGSSHASPRQRNRSRGSERRKTRSLTLNEIRVSGEGISTLDQRPQRRARSSSRLQEGSLSQDRMSDNVEFESERREAKSPLSPRRKHSTNRHEVRTHNEDEEGVKLLTVNSDRKPKGTNVKHLQDGDASKYSQRKTINKTDAARYGTRDSEKNIIHRKRLGELPAKSKCIETQTTAVETRCVLLQTDVTDTSSKFTQTEDDLEPQCGQQDLEDNTRRELGAQEEHYQKQIDELTLSLAEKQEEVTKLSQTLETLRGAQETLVNSEELQEKLSLLQQDVRDRNAQLDCTRSELQSSKDEMELTKAKLKKLEEDLDAARQKNLALQNQITASANCDKTDELETKIKSLEEQLKITEEERNTLSKTIDETEAERDEEIKIIQDALDEAAQEREDLISTFEKEIQNMTKMNTTREQQLMEDFEWKLREMEKDHKKKMEERERKAEERISGVRNMVESEVADSLIKVAEERRIADEKLMEVGHLKSYEAEAIQLRGVTHELQKALRASSREMDHLKVREKILEEEIRGLKKVSPHSLQSTLQRAKKQAEDTEAEFKQKQEKMKNELNAEWEDKLRSECSRLKAELDELHAEEKHLAVESMKVQKEQEVRKLRQSWEQRQEEMTKEISTLKDSLTEKDAYYHKEMENMRTNTDRDVWELRRNLQRLDEKNWAQQEKHHEELERIRADYKERASDLEARLNTALKNSDEEAQQQAERKHNEEMEYICEQHRLSMERLREELESEKFQAVEEARVIVAKHHEYLNSALQDQLTEATATKTQCKTELDAVRSTLALREDVIKRLEDELSKVREATGVPSTSYRDSQSSIASSNDSRCSQGSNNSQDRLSLSESVGASIESQDDAQKSGGSGLLGKVFGGNWFSSNKTKESSRRGSAPGKQSS